jgi:hypothetical protein
VAEGNRNLGNGTGGRDAPIEGVVRSGLWVLEGNDQGRRFYEAAGYTLDGGTKPVEWGRPLIAVRYRKALKRS